MEDETIKEFREEGRFYLCVDMDGVSYREHKGGFVYIRYTPDGGVTVDSRNPDSLRNLHRLLETNPYMRVHETRDFNGKAVQIAEWLEMLNKVM